jgi:isopentenyl diphosphate isomerase/L-lactate dehydrogenase-like FMN-dependent dehydrogenase
MREREDDGAAIAPAFPAARGRHGHLDAAAAARHGRAGGRGEDSVAAILNIAGLRAAAKRRVPRGLFEYVDRGAEDEVALARNTDAFRDVQLLQRVLVNVSKRDLSIDLFGQTLAMPLAIAPTGSAALLCYEGELQLARAAAKAGIPFAISGGASITMERVFEAAGRLTWFQMYMWEDLDASLQTIARAHAAGIEVLLVTVDSAVPPNREYNQKNGFTQPFRITPHNTLDVMSRPGWVWRVLLRYLTTTGMPRYANVPLDLRDPITGLPARMVVNATMQWDVLKQIRKVWPGALLVKGLMAPADAKLALEHGADGVVVSNHGGRNLDPAPATLKVLPRVLEAVGGRIPVLLDGGIRRGSDIAKARALGAAAVLAGRAPLYGAAAAGEAGVTLALELLRKELDTTLGLIGCPSVRNLDRSFLWSE